MSNKIWNLTFLLLICFFLSGCDKKTISPDDISKQLLLDYVKGNEIKKSGYILVNITNTSSECISFPIDYGLELYLLENGERKEIKDKTQYIGNRPYKLNPNNDIGSDDIIVISPDISMLSIKEETSFVALIKGQLCDDESVFITKEIPFVVIP